MGSHASCTLGACDTQITSVYSGEDSSDNLFIDFLRSIAGAGPIPMSFMVGVNQIELGWHGSQDYRFLPGLNETTHSFRDIRGSVRTSAYRGEARLNPEAGTSRTGFRAASLSQHGFFPATQWLELYLRFDLELAGDAPAEQRQVTLVNTRPIVYETEHPLEGFPPLNGPNFVQQGHVDLFDVANLEAGPMLRLEGSRILPSNRRLFEAAMRLVRHDPDGSFEVEADLTLLDEGRAVNTAISWMPSRGIEVDSPQQEEVVVEPGQVVTVRALGRVVDPSDLHLEMSIRAYSMDPEIRGMVTADVPFASQYSEAEYLMEIAHPHDLSHSHDVPTVNSGGRIALSVEPVLGEAITDPEYIWVAPHGGRLDHVSDTSATLVAPVVDEHTDTWVTLYIRQGNLVSRPHKLAVHVLPEGE
jgi:hypothetical protein